MENRRPARRAAHLQELGLEAVGDLFDANPGMAPPKVFSGLRRNGDHGCGALDDARLHPPENRPAAVEGRVPSPEVTQLDDERNVRLRPARGGQGGKRRAGGEDGLVAIALEPPPDLAGTARNPEGRERQRLGTKAREPKDGIGQAAGGLHDPRAGPRAVG
jgi:hypothetical protein